MSFGLFENLGSGDVGPISSVKLLVGWDADEAPVYQDLTASSIGEATPDLRPLPPTLTGSLTSRTASAIAWTHNDNAGRPPVTGTVVERRSSTDDGVSFGAWAAIDGSPFTVSSTTQSGLGTGTPELVFQYRAADVNADGQSDWSNVLVLQWQSTPLAQPTAPTAFTRGATTSTSAAFTWSATTDATVTKQGLFRGSTLVVDNIDPAARSFTWNGLTPGAAQSNVNVRRYNGFSGGSPAGWSPSSNQLTWTQPGEEPPAYTTLMGCSTSDNAHGGTEEWEGWRAYTQSAMLNRANRTGAQRPLFLAYSKQGAPFSGSYNSIFNEVLGDLNSFYYTGGATSQTRSGRWGIKLYWSNGNENSDKGMLANQTPANIALYVESQRALFDAVHYVDPETGQRRFPDAFAGTNPTQEQERTGQVEAWLHPAAIYCDFVMWSMYPPGRGVNDTSLSRNPRWDWPTLNESQRNNIRRGFLTRCFYRTKQAENYARANGKPQHRLIIGCGETGLASNPSDRTCRPYYAAHALAGMQDLLAKQYGLAFHFNCWWDNKTSDTAPHNELSDEPPNSDHLSFGTGAALGNNATATNPSTRVVWQNWKQYDKRIVGAANLPAAWAGNPKSSWNNDGDPI